MERKDVAINDTWDLSGIFASDEASEEEFQKVEKEFGKFDFTVYQGKLADKKTLLNISSYATRDSAVWKNCTCTRTCVTTRTFAIRSTLRTRRR